MTEERTCYPVKILDRDETYLRVESGELSWIRYGRLDDTAEQKARNDRSLIGALEDLKAQISRHCDNVAYMKVIQAEVEVCSACLCPWEPGGPDDEEPSITCCHCGAAVTAHEEKP